MFLTRLFAVAVCIAPSVCMAAATTSATSRDPDGRLPAVESPVPSALPSLLFDTGANTFAREQIAAITANWDMEAFLNVAHEEVSQWTSRDRLQSTFFQYKTLGRPIKIGDVTGGVTFGSLGTEGAFTANGTFENGEARITLHVSRHAGKWRIRSITVESPVFVEGLRRQSVPEPTLPIEEVERRVQTAVAAADLVRLRRERDSFRRLIDHRIAANNKAEALDLLRLYLKAIPNDLLRQIQLAGLLDGDAHADERRMRLEYVRRVAEDIALYRQAGALLGESESGVSVSVAEYLEKKPDVLFVACGDFNRLVLTEVAKAVRLEAGLRVELSDQSVPLPHPDRCADLEYVAALFAFLTNSVSSLQMESLTEGHGKDAPALDAEDQLHVIEKYLSMAGHNTARLMEVIRLRKQQLQGVCAYKTDTLLSLLADRFPYREERASAYMAFTTRDLYSDDANFYFGSTRGPYAVISSFQFVDHSPDGLQCRPTLVQRLAKQVLASVGFNLGIKRCDTPDCARAFPRSVAEHDMKSGTLCEQCRTAFRRYVETGLNPEGGSEYVRIGQAIISGGGEITEAMGWASKGIEIGCQDPAAYACLGCCHAKMSNTVPAAAAYTKAVSLNWDVDVGAHLFLGNMGLSAGSNEMARTHFAAAYDLDTNSIPARIGLTMVQRNLRQFDEGLASARALQQVAPDLAVACELAGDCCFGNGDVTIAIHEYQRSLALSPDVHTTHFNYGKCMAQQGEVEKALKEFKTALELSPTNTVYWLSLGRLLGQHGRAEEALRYFSRANELAPDIPDTWNDKGYTLLQLGRFAESLAVLEEGGERFPSFGLMHYNRALVLMKLGRDRDAIRAYETAVQRGQRRMPVFERLKGKATE